MFKKAIKHESKLRLAIAGPSGSGKTYSALAIGTELGGNVALVDTEHGSASKYADLFAFDVLEMEAPFHPDRFIEAIEAAGQAGYDVLIIDSLSHAWNGTGGLLELVDQFAKRMKSSNTFAAWKDATPIQNRLIEAIVGAKLHIIATMRSKQEYVIEQVQRGDRTISVPKKIGMAPVQRDSMEYEFDVYLDMDIENSAIVQKTRCSALSGQVISKPGKPLADTLKTWLSGTPQPTQDDHFTAMITAETLTDWQDSAYQLTAVKSVFESKQRLEDWRHYVTGNGYESDQNGQLAQVLMDYCDAVANGVMVKIAAQKARDSFAPLFEEEE